MNLLVAILKKTFGNLQALSRLGAFQLGLLVVNAVVTILSILIAQSNPPTSLVVYGVEFFVLSCVLTFLYLATENPYAVLSVLLLQLSQAGFVTVSLAANLIDISKSLLVALTAENWLCIIIFLILQAFVRRSFGWHAYEAAGSRPEALRLYSFRQFVAAAATSDIAQSIFMVSGEWLLANEFSQNDEDEVAPRRRHLTIAILTTLCFSVSLIVSVWILPVCVARQTTRGTGVCIAIYVVGFSMYLFTAVHHATQLMSQGPKRHLLLAMEAIVVLVRGWLIYAIVRIMSTYGLAEFWGGGKGAERQPVIDPSNQRFIRSGQSQTSLMSTLVSTNTPLKTNLAHMMGFGPDSSLDDERRRLQGRSSDGAGSMWDVYDDSEGAGSPAQAGHPGGDDARRSLLQSSRSTPGKQRGRPSATSRLDDEEDDGVEHYRGALAPPVRASSAPRGRSSSTADVTFARNVVASNSSFNSAAVSNASSESMLTQGSAHRPPQRGFRADEPVVLNVASLAKSTDSDYM